MRFLKIEWRNTTDLGSIYYSGGFTNRIFLDVEVEQPDYPTFIESQMDGDNTEVPQFRRWGKTYRFILYCTEDLVDAFTAMQIHDTITITLQTGQQINVLDGSLRVGVEWQPMGCLAKLDVSFAEDYIVGTNCDENFDMDCHCDTYTEFIGFIDETAMATTSGTAGDIIFFYDTGTSIAGKIYYGGFYQLGTTGAYDWAALDMEAYDCWKETTAYNDYFWVSDSGNLVRTPGEIASIIAVSGLTYRITHWGLPYDCLVEVIISGAASGSLGIWPASNFSGYGQEVTFPGAGNYDVELHVYNHSCDYGNSQKYNITV